MTISDQNELQLHARMGMAALIPGFQRAIDFLQGELDELRTELMAMHGRSLDAAASAAVAAPAPAHRGRPRKTAAPATTPAPAKKRSGWPEDPEERRQEMKRRQEVKKAKHKAAALSTAAKDRWANMSVRQRKARLAAMAAGRKQHVNGEALAS